MLIKDDGYMFEIWYYNDKDKAECWHMFSDSPDIYSLKDLPKTTYYIHVLHCDLNQGQENWDEVARYEIGDMITPEEAREEIKALKNLYVGGYEAKFKTKALNGLQAFLQNATNNSEDENSDKIYINKNIKLAANSIDYRIKIIPAFSKCQIISPSQIVKGKVCPEESKNREIDENNSYTDLE